MTLTSHGHHIPGTTNDDEGQYVSVARCGGVNMCKICNLEAWATRKPDVHYMWLLHTPWLSAEKRVYKTKDEAIRDFGQNKEHWQRQTEDRFYINYAPRWDESSYTVWTLEKVKVM